MWPFKHLKIFWKIFLWFWLTMSIMAVVSIFVIFINRNEIQIVATEQRMQALMKRVVRILESDLAPRAKQRRVMTLLQPFQPPRQIREEWREKGFRPIYLVDRQMKDRQGEAIPRSIQFFLQQNDIDNKTALIGNVSLIAGPWVDVMGVQRRLVITQHLSAFQLRFIGVVLKSLSTIHILLYLLTSIALCFLLAYRLTRPVQQLKSVTNAIKQGKRASAVAALGWRTDEFMELANAFDEMTKTTEKTIGAQKQLLSDVSHELRSPLTRMRLAVSLLAKQSKVSSPHLEQIEKDCCVMDEMIAQLLDIAALERGQFTEEKQHFAIDRLINELIDDIKYEADTKAVKVRKQMDGLSQFEFDGFYGLLRSALENIVRNAIRHSPEGSEIVLSIKSDDETYFLSVDDQGGGVNPACLDQLFEAFYRTDEARTRHQGGSGLGLTITRRAVEANGGSVMAKNRFDEQGGRIGLSIVIALPKGKKAETIY